MTRLVSMQVPRAEWLSEHDPDGYWRLTVRERLRTTHARAKAMGLVWLTPYLPQYGRERVGGDRWRTGATPDGFVRATAVRAIRRHFDDHGSDATQCPSVRTLQLSVAFRVMDPAARWADMGDANSWPMALRVDATRLASRFAVLATGTWCVECDIAPWASTTRRCLWCERVGGPPVV